MTVLFELRGVPVTKCTQLRIKQEEQREGYYYYNFRHEDDWAEPYSLEKHVFINHAGSIETEQPIDELEFNNERNHKFIELTEEEIDFLYEYL